MATSLLSQSVKNLVQGISQQPSFIRFPEQLEKQVNGFSTEVDGLQKRPPLVFVKNLQSLWNHANVTQPLVHFINRDASERYVVVFAENTVRIFDIDGTEKTVTIADGTSPYITTNTPRETLQVVTVADHTFVLNKSIVTRMSSEKSPNSFNTQGSMVYVRQGQYGRNYQIWIDGVSKASFTTPDGSQPSHTTQIDTSYIANQLNEKLKQSGVSTTYSRNWIQIHSNGKVTTADGFNNQALINFKTTIQNFSNLPATAPDGYTVKVTEDPNGSSDGSYYVKYDSNNNVWVETVAPNIPVSFDVSTMPHALIRQADGTFLFTTLDWDKRDVGDEDSNPLPSFVDSPLSSIFFYRNRLGFSSRENVILSESGSYFNMWMSTANDLLDTDCIDIPVNSVKSNIINYVVSYAEDLYAFSNDTQFILRTSTVLSPKTSSFAEITQFNSSPKCTPKVSGKNMYFAVDRGDYTSINEYYTVQDVSSLKNAQDISSHVPNYIPADVFEIIPSTINNILLFLSQREPSAIYIYKYLFTEETRVQSAWSKWTFAGDVLGCGFIGNVLYVVLKRGNGILLEKMDFSTSIVDFEHHELYRTMLDMKALLNNGTFDDVYERTSFDLKALYGVDDTSIFPNKKVDVIDDKGKYYPDVVVSDAGTITLDGDYHDKTLIVGLPYVFDIVFSTFYIKESDGGSGVQARTDGRTQVKYVNIQYDHSGYFKANVHMTQGRDFSYIMNSRNLGMASAQLGKVQSDTGVFRFPVHAQNTQVSVEVTSTFPLPLALVGMSWESIFISKTRGV